MTAARVASWPVAVFAFGYGALSIFWKISGPQDGLPGFYYYRSATWGDGVLLPLLALCLVVMIRRLGATCTPTHRPNQVVMGAVLGASVGSAVIVTWLRDKNPVPNWTLPRPGSFTAAGIWHAVFLVAACALFAALSSDLLAHLRAAGTEIAGKTLTTSWACVAFTCVAGYAWLAVSDARKADAAAGGKASLIALAVGAALVVVALASLRVWNHPAYLSTLCVTVALTAFTVVFVDAHAHMTSLVYAALASALASGLGLSATRPSGRPWSAVETLGVCAVFGAVTVYVAVSRSEQLWIVLTAALPAVACAAALRWLRGNRLALPGQAPVTGEYWSAAAISTCLLMSSMFAAWLNGRTKDYAVTGGFGLTIAGAVLGGIVFQSFKKDYVELMNIEGDPGQRSPDGQPSGTQRRAAAKVWLRVASYSVAAFSAVLVLTIALAPSLEWHDGVGHVRWTLLLTACALGVLTTAALGRAVLMSLRPASASSIASHTSNRPAWVCAGLCALVSALVLTALVRDGSLNVLACVQALLISFFVLEGVAGNGAWLHVARLTKASTAALVTVTTATALVAYWSLSGLVRPGGRAANLGESLLAWACCAALTVLLVVTATTGVYAAGGRPYRTDYPPLKGALQDAFLLAILWLALGWLPQTVLAHVPASAGERWAAVGTILSGFMLTFCPPFLWTLENNDTHVCRQRGIRGVDAPDHGPFREESSWSRIRSLPKRIVLYGRAVRRSEGTDTEPPRPDDLIVRLSGHTAAQNALALLLVVVSVIAAVGVTSGFSEGEESLPAP